MWYSADILRRSADQRNPKLKSKWVFKDKGFHPHKRDHMMYTVYAATEQRSTNKA